MGYSLSNGREISTVTNRNRRRSASPRQGASTGGALRQAAFGELMDRQGSGPKVRFTTGNIVFGNDPRTTSSGNPAFPDIPNTGRGCTRPIGHLDAHPVGPHGIDHGRRDTCPGYIDHRVEATRSPHHHRFCNHGEPRKYQHCGKNKTPHFTTLLKQPATQNRNTRLESKSELVSLFLERRVPPHPDADRNQDCAIHDQQ